jgi:hypothetical protein
LKDKGVKINSLQARGCRQGAKSICIALLSVGEGKKGDVTGPFDSLGQLALMAGAGSRHAARNNLAAFADERTDSVKILIVNRDDFLSAETAGLAARTAESSASSLTTFAAGSIASGSAAAWFEFSFLFHFVSPWFFQLL